MTLEMGRPVGCCSDGFEEQLHQNSGIRLGKEFSSLREHQNHQQGLLKHINVGLNPRVSDSVDLG